MAGRFICRLMKLGYVMELLILEDIIESTDGFALQGNSWYCESVIDKALHYKLVT